MAMIATPSSSSSSSSQPPQPSTAAIAMTREAAAAAVVAGSLTYIFRNSVRVCETYLDPACMRQHGGNASLCWQLQMQAATQVVLAAQQAGGGSSRSGLPSGPLAGIITSGKPYLDRRRRHWAPEGGGLFCTMQMHTMLCGRALCLASSLILAQRGHTGCDEHCSRIGESH